MCPAQYSVNKLKTTRFNDLFPLAFVLLPAHETAPDHPRIRRVVHPLKGQEDILDQIKYHVKVIAVGEVIHREKLEEEAAKNGDTSALMTAAAELIQSNSAGPSTSSEKRRVSSDKASSKKAKASK
jgi:hypothetical protein